MPPQDERAPLLQQRWSEEGQACKVCDFCARNLTENKRFANLRQHLRIEDLPSEENPREWTKRRKMANVAVIALMSSTRFYE